MLKKAREIDSKLLSKLFDGVMFKGEYQAGIEQQIVTVINNGSGSGGPVNINHRDTKYLLDDDHKQYLLLTAGSGRPLTGDLYLEGSNPYLVMRDADGDSGSHFILVDTATETGSITKTTATGDSSITMDAKPSDGVSEAKFRMFRGTDTTGENSGLYIHLGNNSDTEQHILYAKGGADFCRDSGWVSVDGDDVVTASRWLQNGFPDSTEVSISWDDGTRTLTLDSVGASFNYYLSGVLYNETGALTATIPSVGVGDEEGLWVFYLDSEGSMTAALNPSESDIDTVIEDYAIVAYVQWDDTNLDGRLMYEVHGSRMSPATHHWIHDNMGAQYKEGMALSDFVISTGSDDEDAQFSIAAGEFYDEDIEHDLAAFLKTEGVEIWYLDGSDWRWGETVLTGTDFNIKVAGSGRMAWNSSGSQVEADANKYVLCHIFATNITDDAGAGPLYISIQGQAVYNTKALAREGADSEINNLVYGTLPLQEVIPVATVIFQTGNYSNKVKSRVVTTDSGDNWVDWRSSDLKSTGGTINDHGSLAGLEDDDHQLYLLASDATDRATFASNWTDLTDGGDTALHIHDARYYTETEIDNSLALYLPLTASHTAPLTGDLYIESASAPSLFLDKSGSDTDFTFFQNNGAGTTNFGTRTATGDTNVSIYTITGDGAGDGYVSIFGGTSTTGDNFFRLYTGQAGSAVQHMFDCSGGNVELCKVGGYVTIEEGNLLIDKTSGPQLQLREAASATSYSVVTDLGDTLYIQKIEPTGAIIGLVPVPADNSSDAEIHLFNGSATTGDVMLKIYEGDAAPLVQHLFYGSGNAELCKVAGSLTVGGTTVSLVGHTHDDRYYTETEIDTALDLYLPLTAGAGQPLTGDLHVEDGSSNDQHTLAASATGDANLCIQGGQVTIGGTGGTQLLTVVDGALGVSNGWAFRGQNNGGTYIDLLKVESGGYRVLMGTTGARMKLLSNDSALYPVPTSAVSDANHNNGFMTFWVDESGNTINFKVKYSGGTVKSGSVALT